MKIQRLITVQQQGASGSRIDLTKVQPGSEYRCMLKIATEITI